MPTRPSVIFINRFFFPDHSATSQMLSDLAFGLRHRGYTVRIITSQLDYSDSTVRLKPRELVDGVDVIRVATTRFGRANLAGRALDYLSFYVAAATAILRHAKPGDVVVSKTDPPALATVSGLMARLKRAKRVNWLQDLFPEVATGLGLGQGGLNRLGTKALTRLRNRSLVSADANVAIGHLMADRVRAVAGGRPLYVIPNWADGDAIRPLSPSNTPLRHAWGLSDAFVVGYSGNLGRAHDVETLFSAIVELCAPGSQTTQAPGLPIRWVFVGGGAGYETLRARIHAHCLDDAVIFKRYQPRPKLGETLAVADVHLISLHPDLEGLIVPSKFYGIAAAGRPSLFIGAPDGELSRILDESGSGRWVAQGDVDGLIRAIWDYRASADARTTAGHRARQLFDTRYTMNHAVRAWDRLLRDLGVAPTAAPASEVTPASIAALHPTRSRS